MYNYEEVSLDMYIACLTINQLSLLMQMSMSLVYGACINCLIFLLALSRFRDGTRIRDLIGNPIRQIQVTAPLQKIPIAKQHMMLILGSPYSLYYMFSFYCLMLSLLPSLAIVSFLF